MRLAAILLLSCAGVFGQAAANAPAEHKPEDLCTVAGVVRNSLTGEPIGKVNLTLFLSGGRASSNPATTTTDAEGKFGFQGIEPGAYRLTAARRGFASSSYGARPGAIQAGTILTLEKGQRMTGIEMKMVPQAVLTGRIVDEEGEPVQGVFVSLLRFGYFNGTKQLVPAGQSTTNDLGEYRIFGVSPGQYYLSGQWFQPMGGAVNRSLPAQSEGFAPTYYPGTAEITSAARIQVAAGRTLQGMDFTLRKVNTYRVRGKVAGIPESSTTAGDIYLYPKGEGEFTGDLGRLRAVFRGPKGEFEIHGARAASYVVRGSYFVPPDGSYTAQATIEVGEGDVDNVVLQLVPSIEIKGMVRVEGEDKAQIEGMTIGLEPELGLRYSRSARVSGDGSFVFPRSSPERYTISFRNVPAKAYVAAAHLGDIDLLEEAVELTSNTSSIEIVLQRGAAKVEGVVTDADGNPVPGTAVLLRPHTGKPSLIKLRQQYTMTDQKGRYRFESIAPGEYRLLAVEGADMTEILDPDLYREHESAAVKIEVKRNGEETKVLTAVKPDSGLR